MLQKQVRRPLIVVASFYVAAAMCEQGGDLVWYVHSGATNHVTNELEQLALRERYHGADQIHTASG